jgi:hypothetical protein
MPRLANLRDAAKFQMTKFTQLLQRFLQLGVALEEVVMFSRDDLRTSAIGGPSMRRGIAGGSQPDRALQGLMVCIERNCQFSLVSSRQQMTLLLPRALRERARRQLTYRVQAHLGNLAGFLLAVKARRLHRSVSRAVAWHSAARPGETMPCVAQQHKTRLFTARFWKRRRALLCAVTQTLYGIP